MPIHMRNSKVDAKLGHNITMDFCSGGIYLSV